MMNDGNNWICPLSVLLVIHDSWHKMFIKIIFDDIISLNINLQGGKHITII